MQTIKHSDDTILMWWGSLSSTTKEAWNELVKEIGKHPQCFEYVMEDKDPTALADLPAGFAVVYDRVRGFDYGKDGGDGPYMVIAPDKVFWPAPDEYDIYDRVLAYYLRNHKDGQAVFAREAPELVSLIPTEPEWEERCPCCGRPSR